MQAWRFEQGIVEIRWLRFRAVHRCCKDRRSEAAILPAKPPVSRTRKERCVTVEPRNRHSPMKRALAAIAVLGESIMEVRSTAISIAVEGRH
jgi:hypothetical protein